MKIDKDWLLILRSAYSSQAIIGSTVAAVIAAVQTENRFSIIASVLALVALLCRVIVQPVLRDRIEKAKEARKAPAKNATE